MTVRDRSIVYTRGASRPPHPVPASRDDREAPLLRVRDGLMISRISEKWKRNLETKPMPCQRLELFGEISAAPTMNLIGTGATNRMTGSKEPGKCWVGNFGSACSLSAASASAVGSRNAAGGSARGVQDRREIHPEIAGRRDDDRAIPEQGYGRLEVAVWVRRQGAFTQLDPEPADSLRILSSPTI